MTREVLHLLTRTELQEHLQQLTEAHEGQTMLLVDEVTLELCAPHVIQSLETAEVICVPAGEECKDIAIATHIWEQLLEQQFSRQDLLLTLGGGAITDLGGFVASSYKRGMRLCHIPTTLLSMVDASIGGKTGVDLQGVKNAVGAFYSADQVLLCPDFLETLPQAELLSGWGEVLKYALLGALDTREILSLDPNDEEFVLPPSIIGQTAHFKQEVVAQDTHDHGTRQQLNLGHTVGHALESGSSLVATGAPIPHGTAVAAGLLCELYLSHTLLRYPQGQLMEVARYVRETFPSVVVACTQYDELYQLAQNDKKNKHAHTLSCILLDAEGQPTLYEGLERNMWDEALDFYRDFTGV